MLASNGRSGKSNPIEQRTEALTRPGAATDDQAPWDARAFACLVENVYVARVGCRKHPLGGLQHNKQTTRRCTSANRNPIAAVGTNEGVSKKTGHDLSMSRTADAFGDTRQGGREADARACHRWSVNVCVMFCFGGSSEKPLSAVEPAELSCSRHTCAPTQPAGYRRVTVAVMI